MTVDVTVSEAGPYQLLPRLTEDEYLELRHDIEANGIRVPVDVDEHGEILDGHHRARIADALRIDCPQRVLRGLSETEKREHALAVNVHRRSLTRQQRRELIAASIKADPEVTDREHARRTGASHPTVALVRSELETSGDVESSSTRRDTLGRQQPASKPARVTETTKTEYDVDTTTGELIDPADVQAVRDALDEHVPDDAYVLASWRKHFGKAVGDVINVITFPVEQVAAKADADLLGELDRAHRDLGNYIDRVRKATGLRVIGGRP